MLVTILKKYIWVINLILLTGLAYLLATTVNGQIEGKLKPTDAVASQKFDAADLNNRKKTIRKKPESYYSVILTRNIFGITSGGGTSSTASPIGSADELPETSLNLVLLGTIMNPDAKSVAIIKNDDNSKVQGYRGGDRIDIIKQERVKLVKVKNCKAVIERIGKPHETIKCKNLGDDVVSAAKLSNRGNKKNNRGNKRNKKYKEDIKEETGDEGINKLGENEYEISRETLEEVLGDPTQIVQEARVIPQKDGLRFFGIRSNSIFWKIGIKNGDTLHKINNVELNDVERALGVFEELRGESNFTIEYTRAGQKYTNEYTVTE
jgi:general secretion pathway protein C